MSPRVLRMNEATSEKLEYVPLPARQQLGIFDPTVDVDARSGNGIPDRVELLDDDGADYKKPNPVDGGTTVQPVTYHLESTPPPAEPAGAPGSESYNRNVRATVAAEDSDTVRTSNDGGATRAAYQRDGEPETTQREQPGRNERIANHLGLSDSASATADSGESAQVRATSDASSDAAAGDGSSDDASDDQSEDSLKNEVPDGSVASVLSWVGDDSARARAAIEKENEKPNPRSSLLSQLNEKI